MTERDDEKSDDVPRALVQVSDEEYQDALAEIKEWHTKKVAARISKEALKYSTSVWVQSLSNVDSVNQTFQCNFELWFRRELSKLETVEYRDNPSEFNAYVPKIFPIGAQETVSQELVKWGNNKEFMICYEKEWDSVVVLSWFWFTVILTEDLELEHFPFDTQHFDIRYQIDWRDMYGDITLANAHSETWEIDYGRCAFRVPNYATSLINWNFEEHACLQIIGTAKTEDISIPIAHMSCVFTLKREWQFYITRVVIILSIISLLTNFVFVFGNDTVGEQFGFISTMLLAGVAYVFVVAGYIPPLKYFTWLDFYLYFTFIYILLIGLEVGIIAIIDDLSEINEDSNIDYVLLMFNFTLWITIHCIFYTQAKKAKDSEMEKIKKPQSELDADDIIYSMIGQADGKSCTMYPEPDADKQVAKRAFIRSDFSKKLDLALIGCG